MDEKADVSILETGDGVVPRIKLGEQGYTGLQVSNGQIYEEANRELRWPNSIKTFKKMSRDATISAALDFFRDMISRVEWRVEPSDKNDEMALAKAQFLTQCMTDMEQSWASFIREVCSFNTYGFSIHEKVYRRRYKTQGSRYNDGLVGLRKLPIRSQDTIDKWLFSNDGRELTGVEQSLTVLNSVGFQIQNRPTKIEIPRNKFLLFRANSYKDNPEGVSPLVKCYIAYKFRTQLEEIEAVGYSRNLGGVPHLELHPRYMASDASDEEKAVYEMYKKIITRIHNNEQAGIITPLMYDPETKQPYFKFSLLSVQNSGSQHIHEAVKRWDKKILTALSADVLILGQDQVGSFSLAGSKTNILAVAIDARLKEIQEVLNNDLIPSLFKLNGWEDEELPKFVYGDLEERDLEILSKAIQRIAAVGLVAKTPDNVNEVAKMLDLPYRVDSDTTQEELDALLGKDTSRAGDGMAKASGNGTSDKIAENNTSDLNTENAA